MWSNYSFSCLLDFTQYHMVSLMKEDTLISLRHKHHHGMLYSRILSNHNHMVITLSYYPYGVTTLYWQKCERAVVCCRGIETTFLDFSFDKYNLTCWKVAYDLQKYFYESLQSPPQTHTNPHPNQFWLWIYYRVSMIFFSIMPAFYYIHDFH